MVVIIVLRSKIKLYEIRNNWYSHSIDEKQDREDRETWHAAIHGVAKSRT